MDIELDKDHQHMTLPKPEYYIIFMFANFHLNLIY
jgi:hypothetical protein